MFDWPHAPLHRFSPEGLYFVTGATYLKQHFYRRSTTLNRSAATLFRLTREHEIALQAWTLFSNHYHLVADAQGEPLRTMLSRRHPLHVVLGRMVRTKCVAGLHRHCPKLQDRPCQRERRIQAATD